MVKMVHSTKVHGKMVLSLIKLSIDGANFLLMYPWPPFFQSFLPQYLYNFISTAIMAIQVVEFSSGEGGCN